MPPALLHMSSTQNLACTLIIDAQVRVTEARCAQLCGSPQRGLSGLVEVS